MKIEIKDSAITNNGAVARYVADHGEMITVASIETAEALVSKLSAAGGGPVDLQKTAPQDSTTANRYLVYRPARRTHSPVAPEADIWTFETTANQYGALGEALFTRGAPALRYYIEQDLEPDDIWIRLVAPRHAVREETVTRQTRDAVSWSPDTVAFAYGEDSVIQEYWCEVKTGSASFQRLQTEGMVQLAGTAGVSVLKIRVRIDDLPQKYSVRSHPGYSRVAPEANF